jgi:predicted amidohydrolase YtcJ
LGAGLAPAIHAIGDRANREVLDIFERAQAVAPALVRRIEHAQLLTEQDIPRFAQLGVVASMQPSHATADWQKVDREWGERGRWAYAFASLQRYGTALAFGSDSPVETIDPLAGVHAAVTRKTADGAPPGGWRPDERLSLDRTLRSYTSGVARAADEASSLGIIAEGQLADFVVLSGDPFALDDPGRLGDLRVQLTAVGGDVVHDALD